MRNVSRALILAVLVVSTTLVVGACSTFAGPAWQVNDVSMSVDDFYAAFASDQGASASSTTTTTDRIQTSALATFMTNQIQEELLTQGLVDKGVVVTQDDRDQAEAAIQQQSSQSGQPAAPSADQIEIQANITALSRRLALDGAESGAIDIDQAARQLYEDNKDSLITPGKTCAHFILVPAGDLRNATAPPTDAEYEVARAEAEAVVARLATEDFATVSAEVSIIDEELPGGDFGCQPISAFPTEVVPLVEAATPGQLSAPTKIEGGYLITRVDSRTPDSEPPPYEDVEDQAVEAVLSQLGQRLIGNWLLDRAKDADVSVDPRFGTWDPANAQVVPPEGAATPTVPTSVLAGVDPTGSGGLTIDPSQLAPTGS